MSRDVNAESPLQGHAQRSELSFKDPGGSGGVTTFVAPSHGDERAHRSIAQRDDVGLTHT